MLLVQKLFVADQYQKSPPPIVVFPNTNASFLLDFGNALLTSLELPNTSQLSASIFQGSSSIDN
jgi:hypothetical protein